MDVIIGDGNKLAPRIDTVILVDKIYGDGYILTLGIWWKLAAQVIEQDEIKILWKSTSKKGRQFQYLGIFYFNTSSVKKM
jgi:hypothetical protein